MKLYLYFSILLGRYKKIRTKMKFINGIYKHIM